MNSRVLHLIRTSLRLLLIAFVCQTAVFPTSTIASGMGHGHGGGRGGGGVGIGIGINISPGMGGGLRYMGTISEAELRELEKEKAAQSEEGESGLVRKGISRGESSRPERPTKLSKPRIRYLDDLAMDIDPALTRSVLSNPSKAIKDYRRTLEKARKTEDQKAEQDAIVNLGNVYFLVGWFSQAAAMFEQLLDMAKDSNDSQLQARAKSSLVAILIVWGDYGCAAQLAHEATWTDLVTGDVIGRQMALINKGVREKYRGSFDQARSNFQESLEQKSQNKDLEVKTLLNLARLDRQWGFKKRAMEYYKQAFVTAKQLDPAREVEILIEAADVYSDSEDGQARLKLLNSALSRLSATGAPVDWVNKLIADAYLDTGMVDQAESYAKSAEDDSTLGRLYLLKLQPQAARNSYEALLRSARNAGNLDDTFTALVGLAKVDEATGNLNRARDNFNKASQLLDEIRATLLPSERRNFYSVRINGFSRSEPARGLIRIAIKQNKGGQSIAPSELVRAMNFSDNLARNFDFDAFGVPQDVMENETNLDNKLASLKTALNIVPKQSEANRYNDLSNQIKKAKSEANAFQRQIAAEYDRYASLRHPEPISIEESLIQPEEYVLIYDMLGDGVGVRLLRGKKVIKSSLLDMKDSELERQIKEFRKPLEAVELEQFDPNKAESLHRLLVADFLKDVPKGVSITIIPDGLLALLPFEALVTEGTARWKNGKMGAYPTGLTYLADRHPVMYYPSLTALTRTRSAEIKKGIQARAFVLADPVFSLSDARIQEKQASWGTAAGQSKDTIRLMAAIEDETGGFLKLPRLVETANLAETCKELYGNNCDAFTGLESNKANFMSKIAPKLDDYRSFVFATHGFTANGVPGIMEPALAFSMVPPGADGFLTMSEVAGLKMSADVAALTACDTGVGIRLPGEGMMSMGSAFLSAGAKSVAMSLWSVSEESSVLLMKNFFRNLKEGKGKLRAWTEARNYLRSNEFEHPFFWAAFVLVGEQN